VDEPLWLSVETVIEANQIAVADTRENHFLRDAGALESAMYKPRFEYMYGDGDKDILDLAVILLFAIAKNHPFEQGNKRAAFITFIAFLKKNGYCLTIGNTEALGQAVTEIIDSKLDEMKFADVVEQYVALLPDDN
jgi:death-on-curing protein